MLSGHIRLVLSGINVSAESPTPLVRRTPQSHGLLICSKVSTLLLPSKLALQAGSAPSPYMHEHITEAPPTMKGAKKSIVVAFLLYG